MQDTTPDYTGFNEPPTTPEPPQNNEQPNFDSFSAILRQNVGAYVVVEFLIGTNNLTMREGILYGAGTNFITLYNDVDNSYTVCDYYSIKFVTFYDPRFLKRRTEAEVANISAYEQSITGEHKRIMPLYYSSVSTQVEPSQMPRTGAPRTNMMMR